MTRRRPLTIVDNGRTIVVRGNAKRVLEAGGFRAPYIGTARGWLLDAHRLPDLAAWLDYRNVAYTITTEAEA